MLLCWLAAAITGTVGQLPAREYSAPIDRDQLMREGEKIVPKVQTHHTYHMQMRDLFLALHQSLLGTFLWRWTDFVRFRVSTALQEQSGQ